jgi:hypothetical protein
MFTRNDPRDRDRVASAFKLQLQFGSSDMVWIPSPHLAGDRPTYIHMYQKILSDHRRSPLSSATSVTILVAPNVDALCAARMFATLFKQDDVGYRIIPVSGRIELEKMADELRSNLEVRILPWSVSTRKSLLITPASKSDTD